jgi:hypothetical protein
VQYEVLDEEAEVFVDGLKARNAVNQTLREAGSGYHVSGLLNDILTRSGQLDGKRRLDEDPTLRFELGYIWEDVLGEHIFAGSKLILLGTLEKDGILGTPDDFDEALWEPHEYKATWSSVNKSWSDRWYWLNQMKAYCYFLGARQTKLKVLFLCGDWKPPRPIVKVYRFFWKDWEIKQTWEMLQKHKSWLQSQGIERI